MAQDVPPATALTNPPQAAPTVTEGDHHAFRRILVPIDFSEHSKKTVSCALNLALRDNAMVHLLHVFQISDYVVTPFARRKEQTDQVKSQIDDAEQAARESLAAFEQQFKNRGIKIEAYIR